MRSRILFLGIAATLLGACGHEHAHDEPSSSGQGVIRLDSATARAIDLQVDTLPVRPLPRTIEVLGELKVPPQNRAVVTTVVGANVASIYVLEEDEVRAGQVLATLRHPDLIDLQVDYLSDRAALATLDAEYDRILTLVDGQVESDRRLIEARAAYQAMQARVTGLEAQLRQVGLDPEDIAFQGIVDEVPLRAPIAGTVARVDAGQGAYAAPGEPLFALVNVDHVHADLVVFEADVAHLRVDQVVDVRVDALPDADRTARIFAIGKELDRDLRAVHVHAELVGPTDGALPGMTVRGTIRTDEERVRAVPRGAVRHTAAGSVLYRARATADGWEVEAVVVRTGRTVGEWVEVQVDEEAADARYVLSDAYAIESVGRPDEEAGHGHSH